MGTSNVLQNQRGLVEWSWLWEHCEVETPQKHLIIRTQVSVCICNAAQIKTF